MSRFLITGGAGYFGTVLTERARSQGHEVRVFDLNPPEDPSVDASDAVDPPSLDASETPASLAPPMRCDATVQVTMSSDARPPYSKIGRAHV